MEKKDNKKRKNDHAFDQFDQISDIEVPLVGKKPKKNSKKQVKVFSDAAEEDEEI